MGKIKGVFILAFFITCIRAHAQDAPITRAGLVRAQLTISPSYSFSDQESYFYLHGNLEGYLSDRLSLSGEAYYGLGNTASGSYPFLHNHSGFFGASWHYVKNSNDLYVGLQPGLAFTRLDESENNMKPTSSGINPLFSAVAGYNFYVSRVFHFFVQSRLILGEHTYDVAWDLSELRLSAGLGFNINTLKPE